MRKLLSTAGMGMVEVMIAAALLGGIALTTSKLTQNMTKATKGTEVKFEYQSLHADVRAWLTDINNATATFTYAAKDLDNCTSSTQNFTNCGISAIRNGNATPNTTKYSGNTSCSGSGKGSGTTIGATIELDCMWITNWVESGTTNTGTFDLNIQYENLGFQKRSTGQQFITKVISIRATVDNNGLVTEAAAAQSGNGTQWLDISDFSGIYYASGGVRVGSTGTVYDGPAFNVGDNNTVSGQYASGQGSGNYVSSISGFAAGYGNTASAATGTSGTGGPMASIAIGRANQAAGSESVALGYGNTTTDRFAVSIGANSAALGPASMSLGTWNVSSGQNSMALGYFAEANAQVANSFGAYVKSNGVGSMTLGDSTTTYLVNTVANSFQSKFYGGYKLFTDITSAPTLLINTSGNTYLANNFSNGATLAVGNTNEIWTQPGANSVVSLYINYRGYNDGNTQARNLLVCDGKNNIFTYFDGSNQRVAVGTSSAPLGKFQVNTGASSGVGNYNLIYTSGGVGYQGGTLYSNSPTAAGTETSFKVTSSFNGSGSANAHGQMGMVYNSNTESYLNGNNPAISVNMNNFTGFGVADAGYRVQVNGAMYASGQVYSNGAAVVSDKRFKKQIEPIKSPIEKILSLEGVTYYWRKDEFKDREFSSKKQIGFIAQQVEKTLPEIIEPLKDGYKTVEYDKVTPILVEAFKDFYKKVLALLETEKEQNREMAALKRELAEEKRKNEEMAKRLERIEAKLQVK